MNGKFLGDGELVEVEGNLAVRVLNWRNGYLSSAWNPHSSVSDQLGSINSQIVQYIEVLCGLGGVLVLAYLTLRVGLPWFFGTPEPGRWTNRSFGSLCTRTEKKSVPGEGWIAGVPYWHR